MAREIFRPNEAPAELNLGGTATTEKVFQDTAGVAVCCVIPKSLIMGSRYASRITVRAGGRVTGGTTTNFTPQLQFGTSATAASNIDVESGAAVAVNSVSGTWMIEAHLVVDVAGHCEGFGMSHVAGSTRTFTAFAVSDTAITTFAPTTATKQGFVVTGTFSGGHASNAAYLDWFELEAQV